MWIRTAVLFVVPSAYERLEVFSGVTALKPIRKLLSERSARQSLARKRPDFGPFPRGKRPKRTGGSNPFAPPTRHCDPHARYHGALLISVDYVVGRDDHMHELLERLTL